MRARRTLIGFQVAADHHADHGGGIGMRGLDRAGVAPVSKNSDPIREPEDFIHFVRHVHDGHAALFETRDQDEQALRGVFEQRTGGLVHQQEPGVHAESARDGHKLHLPDRKRAHHAPHAYVEPHLRQEGAAEGFHGTTAEFQIADDEVFAHGEVTEKVEFLVDDADAQALRVNRTGDGDRVAIDENAALAGVCRPGNDAGERALPRPVFTDKCMHFAG